MDLARVTGLTPEQFEVRFSDARVVLLYPRSHHRTLYLSYVLRYGQRDLVYYRLEENETTLHAWLKGMTDYFRDMLGWDGPDWAALLAEPAPPAELGRALAQQLGQYAAAAHRAVVFYVDEMDRLPQDDLLDMFVIGLVMAQPGHVQLAFSARAVPLRVWHLLRAERLAVVFGAERHDSTMMAEPPPDDRPLLEVYALGRGEALVNGRPIDNWDGMLPRNMFFFLMDNPLVTRDTIFQVFWKHLSTKEATNVFHVTKRKISERIGMKLDDVGHGYELTIYTGGFYVPSPKMQRYYDVHAFEEAAKSALSALDPGNEEALLLRAVDLYRAPFLQDGDMPWMFARRSQLQLLYAETLVAMGRVCQRRDDPRCALGYYVRALRENPEREDVHREVMRLYAALGMMEDARAQYHWLAQTLQERLGIHPARETQELFHALEGQG